MSHAANLPRDDAPLPPPRGPGMVFLVIVGALAIVLWFALAYEIVLVLPRFEKLFAEFHMRLPWFTERVIYDAWWFAPLCLLVVLFTCMGKRTRWLGLLLLIALPIVLGLLILTALYVPYTELVEALGGNAPQF
jgi:hypothetical protein